jgi:hypothetical protein
VDVRYRISDCVCDDIGDRRSAASGAVVTSTSPSTSTSLF